MPEYVDHPVKDQRTWEENVKWRLDPPTPQRYADLEQRMQRAREAAGRGERIVAGMIGGYIPVCDHAVPTEVSFENYLHYRRRCLELGG